MDLVEDEPEGSQQVEEGCEFVSDSNSLSPSKKRVNLVVQLPCKQLHIFKVLFFKSCESLLAHIQDAKRKVMLERLDQVVGHPVVPILAWVALGLQLVVQTCLR